MVSLDTRIFLLRKGTTQQQIADALSLHKSSITLYLSGKLNDEERLDQIAGFLGISRRKLNTLIGRLSLKKAA